MAHHDITFGEAVTLVCNFLNDSNLRNIGQNNAQGGHISVANFYQSQGQAPNKGTLNWYCWKTGAGPAEFFLATEKGVAYNPQQPPAGPISATLYRNQTFTYSGGIDQAAVTAYLTGHTLAVGADASISRADVQSFSCNNFINNFPGNMPGPVYLQYAMAFFNDDDGSIRDFLAQAPTAQYLRYYFAMSIEHGVKGLKVIFFPVDATGKNITTNGGQLISLLERSWPPRP